MHHLSDLERILPSTQAKLSFLCPLEKYAVEEPYYISYEVPPEHEAQRTNLEFYPRTVQAFDIRGHELQFDIERHHFAYLEHKSDISFSGESRSDETEKIERYLKESVHLVKDKLKADLCVAYSYVFRKAQAISTPTGISVGTQNRPDQPAENPHVDLTRKSAFDRALRHLTSEEYSKYVMPGVYRLRILNIWRPLHGIADSHPLILCDPKSIDRPKDLMLASRIGLNYHGKIFYLMHSDKQRWYWLSGMGPDKVLMFVSFDSQCDSASVPHASFENKSASKDLKSRESLEVRVIVADRLPNATM